MGASGGHMHLGRIASAHGRSRSQPQSTQSLEHNRGPRDSPDYEPYQQSQPAFETEDPLEPQDDQESDKEAGEIDADDDDGDDDKV